MSFMPTGTVYATLLDFRGEVDAGAPTMSEPPYMAPHEPRVAAAVEAGMCFVNSQNVRDLRQPFGGTKASGTGREGGTWSYEVFLEPKNIAVSLGSHHIPHWGTE